MGQLDDNLGMDQKRNEEEEEKKHDHWSSEEYTEGLKKKEIC